MVQPHAHTQSPISQLSQTSHLSQLAQLAHLITTSIHTLEHICAAKGTPLPDFDTPVPISHRSSVSESTSESESASQSESASEAFRADAAAAEAAKVVAAACMQLLAVVRPPTDTLFGLALGGLHVDDIARQCSLDPSKLGRILRYLVIHHVYCELKPNVFTNNRVSGTMDTGKSVKEIIANPEFKYNSAQTGFAALISHHLDMDHKSSAVAWEVLKDPVLGHSNEIVNTVFSRGLGLDGDTTYWQFLQLPDNAARHRRFGFAMEAFDWDALGEDSLVVDVGGGIGVTSMPLAKKYPGLSVIIQDLPSVVEEAKKYWSNTLPDDLASGRIKIEAQDFFARQRPKSVSVFILKYILHNWPRPLLQVIRLQVQVSRCRIRFPIGLVMPTRVREDIINDNEHSIGGRSSAQAVQDFSHVRTRTQFKVAPKPLLPNYGAVGHNSRSGHVVGFKN